MTVTIVVETNAQNGFQ